MPNIYRLTAENTLSSRLELFLITCKVDNLSPVTIHDYKFKVVSFADFCTRSNIIDPNTVNTVNKEVISLFLLELRETNRPSSIQGYHKSIKRFFNWLVDAEYLERNPMAKMKLPRVPQQVIKPFAPEQIRKTLAICNDRHILGLRNKALILVLYDTGVRWLEAASINLDDIDFDIGKIKIHGKGAKERVVGIGKQTQRALLKYLLERKDDLNCV